ncbi:MAG: bifunctional ADP-dependent NAD(P)H-hydrate dehydratase/NAD(P)H-hydrate epimerase [Acidobacteria bacterium]|nr:MAG: bifunctional ADP-dependent NAD(P)H-hydrate dehydratase/NAD(P)H-hydrate epimerase [Acidobacteriota bacterium]
MKVLTAAQMREVDRRTIAMGIPGAVLMENAGRRVAEFLEERFPPLDDQRILVFCGKGNNGGDGMVVARLLYTEHRPQYVHVVLVGSPEQMKGEAAENYRKLVGCGCQVWRETPVDTGGVTIVIDALLGTGLKGPASGEMLEAIRRINSGFPDAEIVAVDIPSGLASDTGRPIGESVRADHTVTFTALKVGLVLPPNCEQVGELHVRAIGSPPELFENDDSIFLSLVEPAQFRHLLESRPRMAHKGSFGHVLVVAGSRGKTGAAAMAGMAALRAGAGLVTVASTERALPVIAAHAPELMTEPLPETAAGAISMRASEPGALPEIARNKTVLAIGPGLTIDPETVAVVRRAFQEFARPMVVDADALNALAGADWTGDGRLRVLTPHPGEMSRLVKRTVAEVEDDRVSIARAFAMGKRVHLVLKGYRTLLAFPDGRVWINPTGTPAMAKGGTGDILTGIIAGFLAQFPREPEEAIAAAVYLHGLSGEIGASELGEKCLIATDLLRYLPAAMEQCAHVPDRV